MFIAIEKNHHIQITKNKQAKIRLTISLDTSHGAPIITSST